MRFEFKLIENTQQQLYQNFPYHSTWKRAIRIIPCAAGDAVLKALNQPVKAVIHLSLAIINFCGAAFSQHCSLRDALWTFERGVYATIWTPVALAMAPLEFIYQVGHIMRADFPQSLANLHKGATIIQIKSNRANSVSFCNSADPSTSP